jgi:uncharacterized protein YcnI
MKHLLLTACVALAAIGIAPALAHVSLEKKEAPAGANYKAVLRVPHGCEGSATVAIRVRIPENVLAAKPMPKPGWQLTTVTADHHAASPGQTGAVREIAWTGGHLPDGYYDEFVFRVALPAAPAGTVIRFPVVQQCEKGVHRWIEVPEPGKSAADYEQPAPSVTLMDKPR